MELPGLDNFINGPEGKSSDEAYSEYTRNFTQKCIEKAIEKLNTRMVVTIIQRLAEMPKEDLIDIYWQLLESPKGELYDEHTAFQAYQDKIQHGLPGGRRLKFQHVKYSPPTE